MNQELKNATFDCIEQMQFNCNWIDAISQPLPIPSAPQSAAWQFQDLFQLETMKPVCHLQYLPSRILPEKHVRSCYYEYIWNYYNTSSATEKYNHKSVKILSNEPVLQIR